MKETYVLIKENHFKMIMEKLENLEKLFSGTKNEDGVEWITAKKFKELVSIQSYNTFAKVREKMPPNLIRKINRKHYIHRDAIKRYFQGDFN